MAGRRSRWVTNIGPHPAVAERGLAGFGKPPYLREMMLDPLSSDRSAAGEKPGLSRIRRVVIQQP
jgi:hypothetical protein